MRRKSFLFVLALFLLESIQGQQKHRASVNLIKNGNTISGKVRVNGVQYDLNLKTSESSVFMEAFNIKIPTPGPRGGIIFQDITPSMEELSKIENCIYVDIDANAAFKVQHINENFQLHGIMDNMHISHDGKSHFALTHETEKPIIADYVMFDEKSKLTYAKSAEPRQSWVIAEPELYIFIDFATWETLGKNSNRVAEYLQILVRAVNNRYAATPNLHVMFKIIGCVVLSERQYQPFIEQSRINDGSENIMYNMNQALDKFSDYMYKYKDYYTTNYDLVPLISGEDWKGNMTNGLAAIGGLAWIRGACNDGHYWNSSRKTSISQDKGGFWRGTYILAHELAHGLNSPHDEDANYWGNASQCPRAEGFLMSYEGWGKPNKFRFSECSTRLIQDFITSVEGACLKSDAVSSSWAPTSQQPGDRYSLDDQCRIYLKRRDALAYTGKSPDELCTNLSCAYTDMCLWGYNCTWILTLDFPAFDNSVCNLDGGRCLNGRCLKF